MHCFNLKAEEKFDPHKHVEQVLGRVAEGDVTVACWEPGQTSPYHCHPNATEIYFCLEGGGTMKTPAETVDGGAGLVCRSSARRIARIVNGPQRTLLFRIRYGSEFSGRPKNGRATPTGAHGRRTRSISRRVKRGERTDE